MQLTDKRAWGILLLILVLAAIPRVLSIGWNTIPHGDVEDDVAAGTSLLEFGCMVPGAYRSDPPIKRCPETREEKIAQLHIQHPPAWPIFGAGLTMLLGRASTLENVFDAFKILSFLSGLLTIVLAFVVARKLLSRAMALLVAAWIAGSYIMIDYSGNGSFYMAQAALYLLWLLMAMRPTMPLRSTLMGALIGVGYLINFQCALILLPISSILVLMERDVPQREKWKRIVIMAVVSLIVVLPYLIRNQLAFGTIFQSSAVNGSYLFRKTGQSELVPGNVASMESFKEGIGSILQTAFTYWLPNNLYYAARKLFILAPISFFLFSFAWIDYLFSRERRRLMMPILSVFLFHLFISTAWPVTKFRYFIPLLPLVFLIAAEQMSALRITSRLRQWLAASTVVAMIWISVLALRATPTHTAYYDGALTTDPFGGSEELQFIQMHNLAPRPP